jgi:hypothetical protein
MIMRRGHCAAVDCWAFGVLLCELLTGYAPFAVSKVAHTVDTDKSSHRWRSSHNAANNTEFDESATLSTIAETYVSDTVHVISRPIYEAFSPQPVHSHINSSMI